MDIAVPYTLITPAGNILFNNSGIDRFNHYGPDEYYITEFKGLDGAPLRTPQGPKPQTDGGLDHRFFKDARHPMATGAIVIRSTFTPNGRRTKCNQMERDLRLALESIEAVQGTLQWTPRGLGAHSLSVRQEVPLDTDGIEWFTFTFGLYASNPQMT